MGMIMGGTSWEEPDWHSGAVRKPSAAEKALSEYATAKQDSNASPSLLARLWGNYLAAVRDEMERKSDGESNQA